MTATIVNAAPMSIMLGTQDLSTRSLPSVPEALPTHLPKIYLYTQKGPTTPQLVSGGDLTNVFGSDSFDLRKKWATHATVLANLVNAQGNAIMVQRVKPADAAPNASITLYLDVLPTQIPVYERNIDGSYKVDINNNPVPATPAVTVDGYSVMWVATEVALNEFGMAGPKPGIQTAGTVQSTQFPIMDLTVSNFGSYGNNIGLRMWAPTAMSSTPINPSLITNAQCYPFRMACVSRPDPITTPSIVTNQNGEQFVNVTFKPGVINTATDSLVGINDVFIQSYQLLNVPGYAPVYGPFGNIHTYDAIIDALLKQFYAAELPYINSFSDIIGISNEEYVFNMISGVASSGAPYTSFIVSSSGVDTVYLTENTTIYAKGGSDGTMGEATTLNVATLTGSITNDVLTITAGATNVLAAGQFLDGVGILPGTTLVSGSGNIWHVSVINTVAATTINVTVPGFASLVAQEVVKYSDPNSQLQDSATYPESIIYDSGFPLATKYALANFISLRKDTAVVLCCHDVTLPGPALTASEESSLAIALRTRLQMYPESDFYGTATMRAMIVGRSGKLMHSQYTKSLPLVLEIASKAGAYMGASNGVWKAGIGFDSSPTNQVTMFTDVNVIFTPATVRNKDWANGLVWVDAFDRRSLYFPALKTVYDNDTSVLNSFFTMMAIVELEKVGERARREFSGEATLTNAQLIAQVNEFVNKNTLGRFDNRFVIRPDTYFTAADVARGYSWTLSIAIYAPSMKTVATISVQAYRISDLPT